MSVSYHVAGFVPPDDRYRQMLTVFQTCKAAHVSIPQEVADFFDQAANDGGLDWDRVDPDPAGYEVDVPTHEWSRFGANGFEVRLDEVPDNVQILRFYASY